MTTTAVIRDATAADADAILELCWACDLARVGEPDTALVEIEADLANDKFIAAVIDDPEGGDLLGFVWTELGPAGEKVWGDVIPHPGADPEVSDVLLAWLLERSAKIGPGLPLHTFADSTETAKSALYEAAGGTVVRRFYRMVIDLDPAAPPVVPTLSDGVEIRPVVPGDADQRTMHAIVDTAFRDHFGHEAESYEDWAKYTLSSATSDLSLWWLAYVDGVAGAGLYAAAIEGKGYVDTLGTLREFRGKGLGRALIVTSFAEFHRRGLFKVTLGVDATNPTGALELYKSVGMHEGNVGLRYELHP